MKSTIIVFTSIMTLVTTTLFFAHVAAAATRSSTYSSSSSYGGGDSVISEKDCRLCHEDLKRFPGLKNTNPDKHHLFVNNEIQQPIIAPFVQPGDTTYQCLSCHQQVLDPATSSYVFKTFRDCLQCHPINTVSGNPRSENVHHKLSSYMCSNCHSQRR